MIPEKKRMEIAARIYRCFQKKTWIPLLSHSYPEIEVVDAYRFRDDIREQVD